MWSGEHSGDSPRTNAHKDSENGQAMASVELNKLGKTMKTKKNKVSRNVWSSDSGERARHHFGIRPALPSQSRGRQSKPRLDLRSISTGSRDQDAGDGDRRGDPTTAVNDRSESPIRGSRAPDGSVSLSAPPLPTIRISVAPHQRGTWCRRPVESTRAPVPSMDLITTPLFPGGAGGRNPPVRGTTSVG